MITDHRAIEMMRVTVQYETQVKRAAGVSSVTLEMEDGATVSDVVRTVAPEPGEPLHTLLLNGEGQVLPTLLLFLNDQQVTRDETTPLRAGDRVTIMSPISGG